MAIAESQCSCGKRCPGSRKQKKEMLAKDTEESQGGKAAEVLSATELRVQLARKEH